MMGVLPGAEGVPVNIELSINRCWPRTSECHCTPQWCSGAPVMYAMVLWSNQTRRLVAPCKGCRLQLPVGNGPTDWPRTFDPPLFPIISTASGYRSACGFPTMLDPTSSVCLSYTARVGVQQRSMAMAIFRHEPARPPLDGLPSHLGLCCPACLPVRLLLSGTRPRPVTQGRRPAGPHRDRSAVV